MSLRCRPSAISYTFGVFSHEVRLFWPHAAFDETLYNVCSDSNNLTAGNGEGNDAKDTEKSNGGAKRWWFGRSGDAMVAVYCTAGTTTQTSPKDDYELKVCKFTNILNIKYLFHFVCVYSYLVPGF